MNTFSDVFKRIFAFFDWGPVFGGAFVILAFIFIAEGLRLGRKPAMEGQEGSQTIFRHHAAGAILLLMGGLVLTAGAIAAS